MKEIYMGATVDLIQREQMIIHIDKINDSRPELKETKDGIKYFLIKTNEEEGL